MKSFPIRVVEPDTGTIHSFVYINDKPVTSCGADSGKWPIQVGGAVDCDKCLNAPLVLQ